MGIFDEFGKSLNTAGKAISDAGAGLSHKTQGFAEIAKLSTLVQEQEAAKKTLLEELGKQCYDAVLKSGGEESELVGKIRSTDLKIRDLKDKIAALKGTKECRACGHLNPLEARFCNQCGEKLYETEVNRQDQSAAGSAAENDNVTAAEEAEEDEFTVDGEYFTLPTGNTAPENADTESGKTAPGNADPASENTAAGNADIESGTTEPKPETGKAEEEIPSSAEQTENTRHTAAEENSEEDPLIRAERLLDEAAAAFDKAAGKAAEWAGERMNQKETAADEAVDKAAQYADEAVRKAFQYADEAAEKALKFAEKIRDEARERFGQ